MPVIREQIVHAGFGASHELTKHPRCIGLHGHFYTVAATFTGEHPPGNWGEILLQEDFVKVVGVIRELSGRHLNLMIPATNPNAPGIAGYLLERLTHFGATKVEVHESDTNVSGVAERVSG